MNGSPGLEVGKHHRASMPSTSYVRDTRRPKRHFSVCSDAMSIIFREENARSLRGPACASIPLSAQQSPGASF